MSAQQKPQIRRRPRPVLPPEPRRMSILRDPEVDDPEAKRELYRILARLLDTPPSE